MSVGPLAVRDDLFGFVSAFLTPRQGVDDNTNPKPATQEPAVAAPGPQPNAVPDAATNQAPLPSGTRVIPEGSVGPQAGPVTAADAAILDTPAYRLFQAQQNQLRMKAEEAYKWDTAMSGLSGLAKGMTGGDFSPGGGFGQAARPGSSGATGSDALSLEQFRQFSDDATKAKAAAEYKASAYAFAQANGIPKSTIDAAIAGGDYGKLRELGFNRADPKAAGEGTKAQLEAGRLTEFDRIMKDPGLAGRVMAATGISDLVVLRTLYDAGKLDTVLEKAAMGGPDYAEYMKAYPGGTDARTGLPFTYADYLNRKQNAASPTGGMSKKTLDLIGEATGAKVNAGRVSSENMAPLLQTYDFLRNDKAQVGGILGRDDVQAATRFIQGLNIPGLDMKGLDVNAQLKQGTTSILLTHAKALGVNPTDRDAKIIEDYANGTTTNSREAMLAMQRTLIRGEVQKQLNANAAIDRILPALDPDARAALEGQRVPVADYTGIVFHPQHVQNIEAGLAAGKNPAVIKSEVDRQYGPGMYDYYVGQKHPELRGR